MLRLRCCFPPPTIKISGYVPAPNLTSWIRHRVLVADAASLFTADLTNGTSSITRKSVLATKKSLEHCLAPTRAQVKSTNQLCR